jgi:hypothetical protein
MQSEFKKLTTAHGLLHLEYMLLFIWALCCSTTALFAQVEPAARGRSVNMQFGGTLNLVNPDYGSDTLKGLGLYVTSDFARHLGIEAEFHQLDDPGGKNEIYERTFEVGPRYVWHFGRFDPYAKRMFGRGIFNFPPSPQNPGPGSVANLAYNMWAAGICPSILSFSPVVHEVVQSYDFALALPRTTLSIPSGDNSNITVTVSPIGGFAGAVSLSCEGLPNHAQCVFPLGGTVSMGDGAKTVTPSINTSDVYGYGKLVSSSTWSPHAGSYGQPLIAILLPALGLLGLSERRRKLVRFVVMVWMVVGLIAVMLCMQSCSGKLPGETPPGTYTLALVGTSTGGSSLQHSVPAQLIVMP